jgi:hypothetical protein
MPFCYSCFRAVQMSKVSTAMEREDPKSAVLTFTKTQVMENVSASNESMTENLSTEVADFILNHTDSVGEMAVLLLLAQDANRWWSSESVYEEIKSSRASLIRPIERLSRRALLMIEVEDEGFYRFCPTTADLTKSTKALREAYAERATESVGVL